MIDEPRILIACENDALRTALADNLTADGHEVLVAHDPASAIALLQREPAAVVIDLNGSALEVVDRIRGAQPIDGIDANVPLLMLSRDRDVLPRVRAYERGVDDFIIKPFSYRELRLRLAAVIRRAANHPPRSRVRIGPLTIEPASRDVRLDDAHVALSAKEYGLLLTLANEPSRVFTKHELLRTVWGFRSPGSTRTLDSHACRLRRKLEHPEVRFVVNVWGVGYRLLDGSLTIGGQGGDAAA